MTSSDPFERHGIDHLSPSSLRLWRDAPAVWIGKYLLRAPDEVGPGAWRGKAVEAGVDQLLYGQQAGAAATGLEDARKAISLGDDRAHLYWTAAALAAAELKDQGSPMDDPLNGEGREYLTKAVANGYPRTVLRPHFKLLPLIAQWESLIPPAESAEQQATKMDDDIRLIDPISD